MYWHKDMYSTVPFPPIGINCLLCRKIALSQVSHSPKNYMLLDRFETRRRLLHKIKTIARINCMRRMEIKSFIIFYIVNWCCMSAMIFTNTYIWVPVPAVLVRLPTIITSAHNIFFFFFLCTVNCVFDSLNEEGIDGEDWEQIISKYQNIRKQKIFLMLLLWVPYQRNTRNWQILQT